jgi:Tfp pilus assembly protein PilF
MPKIRAAKCSSFELGKNYLASKDYPNAFFSFQKASEIDPTNKWFS